MQGLVTRAISDVTCVVDDVVSHSLEGFVTDMYVWERAVVPMVLNNARTWQEMSSKCVDALEKLQITF